LHSRRHVSKEIQAQNFKRGRRCDLRERAVKHPNTHPPIFFCNPPKLLLLLAAWRKLPTNSKKNTRTHTQDFFTQRDTKTYKISSHRDTHKQTRFLCKKHKIDKTNNQIIQFLGSKISKTI
jgi:hypothetical protein